MSKVEGVIGAVFQDVGTNGKTRYTLVMDGGKTRFSCGYTNPEVAKGDSVSFDVDVVTKGDKTYNNVVVSSLRRVAAKATPTTIPAPGSSYSAGRSDWDMKNRMTAWHAARAQANDLISVALAAGVIGSEGLDFPTFLAKHHDLSVKLFEKTQEFLAATAPAAPVAAAPAATPSAPAQEAPKKASGGGLDF